MRPQLLLGPPAAGKTQACVDRLCQVMRARPFCVAWAIVADRAQALAFQRRLAGSGGILGARVATFSDFYREILERSGRQVPLAEDAMLHRLAVQLVRELQVTGRLPYFEPISAKPGFVPAIRDRIAELKQALVLPGRLLDLALKSGQPGLADLAVIYDEYQARLRHSGWADPDGLGWLAIEALRADPRLLKDWTLLVVDGFDGFSPLQARLLGEVSSRIGEVILTLPGGPGMARSAHRRFQPAINQLVAELNVEIVALTGPVHLPLAMRALEAGLFEPPGQRCTPLEPQVNLLEARSPGEEAREALRWIKARVVRDGLAPGRCALAVAEFGPYRDALRAAAQEFGIALRFSQGSLLAAVPCAAALWSLIGLAPGGFGLRPLLNVIRSPFFNLNRFGLTRMDAKALEIASRYGQVTGGLAQWEEVLTALENTSVEEDARPR